MHKVQTYISTGLTSQAAQRLWKLMLAKIFTKVNGRNEIFEKKIHGKEESHDRANPLLG